MSEKKSWLRKDRFENGIFWELYTDLEAQFRNFLEYVPYLDGNENVYSFRLVNLILSIGSHVDSAFKEMARYKGFANNVDCQDIIQRLRNSEEKVKAGKAPITIPIRLPLRAFEKEYKLSKRKIIFKRLPEGEEVTPFEPYNPQTNAPKWWDIYNGLKHDVSINLMKANLQNTLHALAGAFLLNVCHIPAAFRLCEYGAFKAQIIAREGFGKAKAKFDITCKILKGILEKKQEYPAPVETPLFIYNYDQ